MNYTIATTVFGVCAMLWLTSGIFFFKKNENTLVGISWISLIIIILNCFHCFVAAVMDPIGIPINIVSIGIVDIVAGTFFWYKNFKNRQWQKYSFALMDLLLVAFLVIFLFIFAKVRFGGWNLNLNYLTIDPANHLAETVNFMRTQSVSGMFYEFVWNGLFMELLAPFSRPDYYYRYFVLSDLINLGLAAVVFYGVERRHTKNVYSKIVAVVLALAYVIGYPLCSTLYGFVYLGMGITLISAIMLACDMYMEDEMPEWLGIVMLMLGCLGIFECYALFMPVVFFAVISCVFVKQKRAHMLISWKTIVVCLSIFLIPCIVGFAYTYAHIFAQNDLSVGAALVNEGACYRDLYSNFIFFLPAMIYAFWLGIRKKQNTLVMFLAPYSLLYTLYLLYKVVNGTTSTYYYYKIYFLLWLIAFVLIFQAAVYAEKETRILALGGIATWCLVTLVYVGKIEEKFQYHNALLVPEIKSDDICSIVNFNYGATPIQMPAFNAEKVELYHYVAENMGQQGAQLVPLAGYWEDDYWYQAITNQRYYGWGQSDPDHTDYFNHLNESEAQYVLVLKDSAIYADEMEYFDSLERVYENNLGFVGIVQEKN